MAVGSLAYDSALAVTTGWGCDANAVAVSTSSGKAWSVVTTGNPCGPVSAYVHTVVMSCANLMPGGQYLLLSRDGGGHWAAAGYSPSSAGYSSVSSVAATATSAVWATGPAGALWHTSDGGDRWRASPLLLPLVP